VLIAVAIATRNCKRASASAVHHETQSRPHHAPRLEIRKCGPVDQVCQFSSNGLVFAGQTLRVMSSVGRGNKFRFVAVAAFLSRAIMNHALALPASGSLPAARMAAIRLKFNLKRSSGSQPMKIPRALIVDDSMMPAKANPPVF